MLRIPRWSGSSDASPRTVGRSVSLSAVQNHQGGVSSRDGSPNAQWKSTSCHGRQRASKSPVRRAVSTQHVTGGRQKSVLRVASHGNNDAHQRRRTRCGGRSLQDDIQIKSALENHDHFKGDTEASATKLARRCTVKNYPATKEEEAIIMKACLLRDSLTTPKTEDNGELVTSSFHSIGKSIHGSVVQEEDNDSSICDSHDGSNYGHEKEEGSDSFCRHGGSAHGADHSVDNASDDGEDITKTNDECQEQRRCSDFRKLSLITGPVQKVPLRRKKAKKQPPKADDDDYDDLDSSMECSAREVYECVSAFSDLLGPEDFLEPDSMVFSTSRRDRNIDVCVALARGAKDAVHETSKAVVGAVTGMHCLAQNLVHSTTKATQKVAHCAADVTQKVLHSSVDSTAAAVAKRSTELVVSSVHTACTLGSGVVHGTADAARFIFGSAA